MEKITIQTNEEAQYIPLTPTKPQLSLFAKEESWQFRGRDYNYDGSNQVESTQTVDPNSETITAGQNYVNLNSFVMPTDYIGAASYNVPHYINENYANFTYYDLQTILPASLPADVDASVSNDLYDSADADLKLVTIRNGVQFLRIPANKFNTVDADGQVTANNYGKYYISVTPKYIETTIYSILPRTQLEWSDIQSNTNTSTVQGNRRRIIQVDKTGFFGTAWQLEANALQQGRLFGSVVEVWDASGSVLKQTLIVNEDSLGLTSTAGYASLVLQSDLVGYESPSQAMTLGDTLRIYPRETYFNPIDIELTYSGTGDVLDLVRFMMNDVVQDTTRSVYEVYDDTGVSSDGQGNLSGNVILSYQISQEGKYTIRRKNPLATNNGNTIQTL